MASEYAKNQAAGFTNQIKNVALVGATGRIGSYFAKHLLATGKHTVTAITRASGKAELPEGLLRAEVDYDDESTLVAALKGQDFLVITMGAMAPHDLQGKLIRAAAEAGVRWVMPNAYGPDPVNKAMTTDMGIGHPFFAARDEIEKLGVSSWIALATGFWYEWSLCSSRGELCFGCGIHDRKMVFFDDGEQKITTTTWEQCGRALAALLSLKVLPEDERDESKTISSWANKPLYVSSFRVSQKDMFESVKRVTGTTDADWKIEHVAAEKRFNDGRDMVKNGVQFPGFIIQMYTRVFFPSGEGDHSKLGLANEALGLPVEDIDEHTKEGLRLQETGILDF